MGSRVIWDRSRSYERVALSELTLALRVGVFAAEEVAAQPVRVTVELYRHRGTRAVTGLAECLDYDRVYRYLTEDWPARPHVPLLETWAEDLVRFCLQDERVEACRVRLCKPAIYGERALPEVELYRLRSG